MPIEAPNDSSSAFRPRTALEVIDAGVQLLRRNYGQFVTLAAAMYVPIVAVAAIGVPLVSRYVPSDSSPVSIVAGIGIMAVALFAACAWSLIVDASLAVATADAYFGRPVAAGSALRRTIERGGQVVRAGILKGLILGAVVIAPFIVSLSASTLTHGAAGRAISWLAPIAGAILFLRVYAALFAVPAATVLEPVGAAESIGRSRRLAKDSVLRILGILILTWLLCLIGYVLVSVAGAMLPGVPDAVVSLAGAIFIVPLLPAVSTVLYFDQRIRREGYDIAMASASLDAAA